MQKLSFVNGQYYHTDEHHISSLDRAIHFGDACYETIYCYKGHLLSYTHHLARLKKNLKAIGITPPPILNCLQHVIVHLMRNNSSAHEGYAFICISSGAVLQRTLKRQKKLSPSVIVHFFAKKFMHKDVENVSLITENRWSLPSIKNISLIANVIAANSVPYDHLALYHTEDNFMTEGTHYNFFIVKKNGTLVTTEAKKSILSGCTRSTLIKLAKKAKIPVEEAPIHKDDLLSAKEVIASSSLLHVGRIKQVENVVFTDTAITDKLRTLYTKNVMSL